MIERSENTPTAADSGFWSSANGRSCRTAERPALVVSLRALYSVRLTSPLSCSENHNVKINGWCVRAGPLQCDEVVVPVALRWHHSAAIKNCKTVKLSDGAQTPGPSAKPPLTATLHSCFGAAKTPPCSVVSGITTP
uniref:Uncharacterized protein n=1 Tax=Knipowitschia caucasica TaxID=637954 RepID=A0AAV2LS59_KNICA